MTPDGKKVLVDTTKDLVLYAAPCNPPNTGTAYTRGTDLYVHRARSGREYYYLYRWSLWQGDYNAAELISADEAKSFLLEQRLKNLPWGRFNSEEIEKRFPALFDEDA